MGNLNLTGLSCSRFARLLHGLQRGFPSGLLFIALSTGVIAIFAEWDCTVLFCDGNEFLSILKLLKKLRGSKGYLPDYSLFSLVSAGKETETKRRN